MDDQAVALDRAAQRRAYLLTQVLSGRLTVAQAATLLGLSVRQVKRLKAAYGREGPAALVHGNRGRTPWHAVGAEVREHVVALARGPYAGWNAQHLTEQLAEHEGLALHPSTVRRILAAAGVRPTSARRPPAHRRRRERLPREGLLLQGDGSRHRWLGPEQPSLTLIGLIDDATGTIPAAVFRDQEDAAGYLLVLRTVLQTKGVPTALYVDRHGIFRRSRREPLTLEEELAGGPAPTQVARALAELDIRLILALSPQAKGRIERLWGTLQDRLVAELRRAGVTTLAQANAFLPAFLPRFNARFAVPPAEPTPAYRPLPPGLEPDAVCCFKYRRHVRPDNTVTVGARVLQLPRGPAGRAWSRVTVEVREHLDGSLAVAYQGHLLAHQVAPLDAPLLRARGLARPAPAALDALTAPTTDPAPPPFRPSDLHPWRTGPRRRPPDP